MTPETASSPEGFCPRGWQVLERAEGDLDQDGLPDAAVVFSDPSEDTNLEREIPRLLVIALRKSKGQWVRSAVSEVEILCRNCGGVLGDPFAGLKIERGTLVVDHYGGSTHRWNHTHRYRLENGSCIRIGETVGSEHTALGTSREVDRNLITGRVVETTRDGRGHREKTYTEFRPIQSTASP